MPLCLARFKRNSLRQITLLEAVGINILGMPYEVSILEKFVGVLLPGRVDYFTPSLNELFALGRYVLHVDRMVGTYRRVDVNKSNKITITKISRFHWWLFITII